MSAEENEYDKIEKCIRKANSHFTNIIESNNSDEKEKFDFFREKYIQFVLYRLLTEAGWNCVYEGKTEKQFSWTGKKSKSGNHDLVIIDENNCPVIGFEYFLGYFAGEKDFSLNDFKRHFSRDYQKLCNSSLKVAYIINYFYKGETEKSSLKRTIRKQTSYNNTLSGCVSYCRECCKQHKESGSNIKLVQYIAEARDDGELSRGVIRIC